MTVWGVGRGLQLPGTTTSTLHTDTIDYRPSSAVYKTPVDDTRVAYVDLGSRDNKHNSVHYGSAYIMGTRTLLDPGHTYRLDRNTEPADNISWEPFTAGAGGSNYLAHSHPTLPIQGIPSTRL